MGTLNTTIKICDIEFECEFDFQPFEPAERGPEAQYPGCHAMIEGVHNMMHKGTDFYELLFEDNEDLVMELLWESMRENEY